MKKLILLLPLMMMLGGCFECSLSTPLFGDPSVTCGQTE